MADEVVNDEMIAFWKEAGERWVEGQPELDAMLAPFAEMLLDHAAVRAGERVLDVGCGCGALALAASERTAASGAVTGVDVSGPMLARARDRARDAGLAIELLEADAQAHAFASGTFDAILSRFGVMFFADPVRAFGNLRGALEPDGRFAFVCWQARERNPWFARPTAVAASHVALDPPGDPEAPGPFAFADADRVSDLLARAGFGDVEIVAREGELAVGGGVPVEGAVEFMLRGGPVARAASELAAEPRARLRDDLRAVFAPHETAGVVRMPYAAWLVHARVG